jgi:D-alanyl-D-alanine carboxypeptidase (penicillin-binding protein 5/6)
MKKRWNEQLKRNIARMTAVLLLFSAVFAYNTLNAHAEGVPISASSAVVMEATTGRVLYEKNAHENMPMA